MGRRAWISGVLFLALQGVCAPEDPQAASSDSVGDPLPAGAFARYGSSRHRCAGDVLALAFAPDGQSFFAGSEAGIEWFDTRTGKRARHLHTHEGLCEMALSPDGQTVAAGTKDGHLELWTTETGAIAWQIRPENSPIVAMAFSNDGSLLAIGTGAGAVRMIESKTGHEARSFEDGRRKVNAIAFSPDGKHVAFAGEDDPGGSSSAPRVHVFDVSTWSERAALEGHDAAITALAFTPRGISLASADDGGVILLHDITGGDELMRLGEPGRAVGTLRISTDGLRLLSAGDDGAIRSWDMLGEREPARWESPQKRPAALDISRDRRRLVFSQGSAVVVWNPALDESPEFPGGHTSPISAIAYVHGSELIATGGEDGFVRLWDRSTGKPAGVLACGHGRVECIRSTDDGKELVVLGGEDGLSRWDLLSKEKTRDLSRAQRGGFRALSADGSTLVASDARALTALDTATGEMLVELTERGGDPCALSQDGRMLAVASENGEVRILSVASRDTLQVLQADLPRTQPLSFSPDGRMLLLRETPDRCSLWELASGSRVLTLPLRDREVDAVTFTPDGRSVVVLMRDNRIQEIGADARVRTTTLPDAAGRICAIAFDTAGRLFTANTEGTALGWLHTPPSAESISSDAPVSEQEAARRAALDRLLAVPKPQSTTGNQRLKRDSQAEDLPPWAVARLGTDRFRHGNEVTCLAWSPDGRTIAGAELQFGIRLWNASTGVEVAQVRPEGIRQYSMAFSADGKSLVAADRRRAIIVDLLSNSVDRTFAEGPSVTLVAVSPKGDRVATNGEGRELRLWAWPSPGETLHRQECASGIGALEYSGDGALLAVGGNEGAIELREGDAGALVRRLEGHRAGRSIHSLDFSPDGGTLASWSDDSTIRFWGVGTGELLLTIERKTKSPMRGPRLAWSPRGDVVAVVAGDWTVRLLNPSDGTEAARIPLPVECAAALAFSPDGTALAIACRSTILVWEIDRGKSRDIGPGHVGAVRCVAVSPRYGLIASGGEDGTVRVWDPDGGRELHVLGEYGSPVLAVAFLPDGDGIVSVGADGRRSVWRPGWTGRARRTWRKGTSLQGAVASDDGTRLALLSYGDSVRIEDSVSGEVVWQGYAFGMKPPLFAAFAADEALLAILDGEGTMRFLDVEDGEEARPRAAFPRFPKGLAFSSAGGLLAVHAQGTVLLVEAATMGVLAEVRNLGWNGTGLSFGFPNRWLACPDERGAIAILDLGQGSRTLRLSGHRGEVACLATFGEGRYLASGGTDSTILVWDLAPALAREAGTRGTECAWEVLGCDDPRLANEVCARLSLGEGRTVESIAARLRQPSKEREEARRLVQSLLTSEGEGRMAVERALRRLGSDAAPALREALSESGETPGRQDLERLLDVLDCPIELTPGDTLRRARGVRILEEVGSVEALSALEEIAKGDPLLRETQESQSSSARLRSRLGRR